MLEIFANPSTYDLYTIALGAFSDWKEVNEEITKALEEFHKGKCARSGFVFGKILRKIIESDSSLTGMVWGGIQKTAETISNAAYKAKDKIGSVFQAAKDFIDEL